ncbi:hypothetical protein [Stenotrophomonas sp. PS02298]|uniref:hypothetical protein n=1 Tax=Stenotrophomonas sp. PS02298 TaxID=2991424 RepID=UPI002499CF95|nr:hypothetical protein [Stenotrophomonas sp. PS02298]
MPVHVVTGPGQLPQVGGEEVGQGHDRAELLGLGATGRIEVDQAHVGVDLEWLQVQRGVPAAARVESDHAVGKDVVGHILIEEPHQLLPLRVVRVSGADSGQSDKRHPSDLLVLPSKVQGCLADAKHAPGIRLSPAFVDDHPLQERALARREEGVDGVLAKELGPHVAGALGGLCASEVLPVTQVVTFHHVGDAGVRRGRVTHLRVLKNQPSGSLLCLLKICAACRAPDRPPVLAPFEVEERGPVAAHDGVFVRNSVGDPVGVTGPFRFCVNSHSRSSKVYFGVPHRSRHRIWPALRSRCSVLTDTPSQAAT